MDDVERRAVEQAAGDDQMVDRLHIAVEPGAVALRLGEQAVEVGHHPARLEAADHVLEPEAVKIAEHAEHQRRIGRQRVVDIGADGRGLGGARGVASVGGRLDRAPGGIAAEPCGEVDVDQRHLLAVEAEGADQRLAQPLERRASISARPPATRLTRSGL